MVGSYSKVLALFYQAVEGVVAMHGQGLVHRDIKLENIMVSCKENRCYAAVIDLGLACEEGTAIDTGGTPGYMAPEAWDVAGNGHAAGDIFSLGVVLYRLVYSQLPPFHLDKLGIQTKLYKPSEDETFKGQRTQLDDLVMAMLMPDPERRISIMGVLKDLRSAIEMENPPKYVLSMLSSSPTQRRAKDQMPECLFQQPSGDVKDVGDKPFHRLDCADIPQEARFRCGFCLLCNRCCTCSVKRHGTLVPEFFRMESCQ